MIFTVFGHNFELSTQQDESPHIIKSSKISKNKKREIKAEYVNEDGRLQSSLYCLETFQGRMETVKRDWGTCHHSIQTERAEQRRKHPNQSR